VNHHFEEQVALRAHQLWIERGCPCGTPEADWYRAEKELSQTGLAKVAREVGSAVGRVVALLSGAETAARS